MRILVTGSAGMLGTAVMRKLADSGHTAVGVDLQAADPGLRLDISRWDTIRELPAAHDCELVMHLAAATDVDRCEMEPEWALRQNALTPQLWARLCADRGIPIVYISTAAVFGANPKAEPYTEYDVPAPSNRYAESKLRGEEAVREATRRHFIIRAAWMMGGISQEKKFVGKIVAQILAGQKRLLAVADKRGTLTYTEDLAANLLELVASGHYGTYHMANPGVLTRHDVARLIVEQLGAQVEVEAVSSDRFPLPAPRPASEALNNFKLAALGLDRMPSGADSLARYVSLLVPALSRK
ncbi:MAG: sugar nucleotide-binding protein [Elusimicrobia bacterium]|nr:sugar nucleotide-binding protein [Elusimicrobiota bacterium]